MLGGGRSVYNSRSQTNASQTSFVTALSGIAKKYLKLFHIIPLIITTMQFLSDNNKLLIQFKIMLSTNLKQSAV